MAEGLVTLYHTQLLTFYGGTAPCLHGKHVSSPKLIPGQEWSSKTRSQQRLKCRFNYLDTPSGDRPGQAGPHAWLQLTLIGETTHLSWLPPQGGTAKEAGGPVWVPSVQEKELFSQKDCQLHAPWCPHQAVFEVVQAMMVCWVDGVVGCANLEDDGEQTPVVRSRVEEVRHFLQTSRDVLRGNKFSLPSQVCLVAWSHKSNLVTL